MKRILLIWILIQVSLQGNIWPWADFKATETQINGDHVNLFFYFTLESTLNQNTYIKVDLPFTPDSGRGFIYQAQSRVEIVDMVLKRVADVNKDGNTLYVKNELVLLQKYQYVLELFVNHGAIGNTGPSGVISMSTITSNQQNGIIIDYNPVFGWFEWNDASQNGLNFTSYSTSTAKEKYAGVTWNFNFKVIPQVNITQTTQIIIEIIPQGQLPHIFSETSTCSVTAIEDVKRISSVITCNKLSSNSLEIIQPYGIVSNKSITIQVNQIQNPDWNFNSALKVSTYEKDKTAPVETMVRQDYFQTQLVSDNGFISLGIRTGFGQPIKPDTISFDSILQIYKNSPTNPQPQYQNVFIDLILGSTLPPIGAEYTYSLELSIGDSSKFSLQQQSLVHNLLSNVSGNAALCEWNTDTVSNYKLNCENFGNFQTSKTYTISFRIAFTGDQKFFQPKAEFIIHKTVEDQIRTYVYATQSGNVTLFEYGLDDESPSNPISVFKRGGNNYTTSTFTINPQSPTIEIGNIGIYRADLTTKTGIDCIFNPYVEFDGGEYVSSNVNNYGIWRLDQGNRQSVFTYDQYRRKKTQQFSRFQAIFKSGNPPQPSRGFAEIPQIKVKYLDTGRAENYAFDVYCGIFTKGMNSPEYDMSRDFINQQQQWVPLGVVSGSLELDSTLILTNIDAKYIFGNSAASYNFGDGNFPGILRVYGSQNTDFGINKQLVLFFSNIVPDHTDGVVPCVGNNSTEQISCIYSAGGKTTALTKQNMHSGGRIDVKWNYFQQLTSIDFQILIPIKKQLDGISKVKILIATYDSINLNIIKLSKIFDQTGSDISNLVTNKVTSHSATTKKLHFYCDNSATDCILGATLTSQTNRLLKFSIGGESITKNVFTSGSEAVGAALMWCTTWDSNAQLQNSVSSYSESGTGKSQDKCAYFKTMNKYCVFCPLSKDIPAANTDVDIQLQSLNLWTGTSQSINGSAALGIVSTNTGQAVFIDGFYQVNPAAFNVTALSFTDSIQQGDSTEFNMSFQITYPIYATKISLTFGSASPSIPVLNFDISYKLAITGIKNNYTISKVTAQSSVISIEFQLSQGSSLNDTVTINAQGFQCPENEVETKMNLATVQVFDDSNYIIEKIQVSTTKQFSVIAASTATPDIQKPVIYFPQLNTVSSLEIAFKLGNRKMYQNEYFQLDWSSYYEDGDKLVYRCIVLQMEEDYYMVDQTWQTCQITDKNIVIQTKINRLVSDKYIYIRIYGFSASSNTFEGITGEILTPEQKSLPKAYKVLQSNLATFTNENKLLDVSKVKFVKSYNYQTYYSTYQFSLTLDFDIDENTDIYIQYPKEYSPSLSSNNRSISASINQSPTPYMFWDDHLILLYSLAIGQIKAGTQFNVNITGVQIPQISVNSKIFIYINNIQLNKYAYAVCVDKADVSIPGTLNVINFYITEKNIKSYGDFVWELHFNQKVEATTSKLIIELPSSWIKFMRASQNMVCKFYLKGATELMLVGIQLPLTENVIELVLNQSIAEDQGGQVKCQNVRTPDDQRYAWDEVPVFSVVDNNKGEKEVYLMSSANSQNTSRLTNLVGVTLPNINYDQDSYIIYKGLLNDDIILTPEQTYSQQYSQTPANFFVDMSVQFNLSGINPIPSVPMATIGDSNMKFQLSASANLPFGKYFLIPIQSTSSVYAGLNILEVTVSFKKSQITLPSNQQVPGGGRSVYVNVQLQYMPAQDIQIDFSVNDTDITVIPSKLYFKGTKSQSIYIKSNSKTAGKVIKVSASLSGANSAAYQLPPSGNFLVTVINEITDIPILEITEVKNDNQIQATSKNFTLNIKSNSNLSPAPGGIVIIWICQLNNQIQQTFNQLMEQIINNNYTQNNIIVRQPQGEYLLSQQQLSVGGVSSVITINNLEPQQQYILNAWVQNVGGVIKQLENPVQFNTSDNGGRMMKVGFNFTLDDNINIQYNNLVCFLTKYFGVMKKQVRSIYDDQCNENGTLRKVLVYNNTVQVGQRLISQFPVYFYPNMELNLDEFHIQLKSQISDRTLTVVNIKNQSIDNITNLLWLNITLEEVWQQPPDIDLSLVSISNSNNFTFQNIRLVRTSNNNRVQPGFIYYIIIESIMPNVTLQIDKFRAFNTDNTMAGVLYYDGIKIYPQNLQLTGLQAGKKYTVYFVATNDDPSDQAAWSQQKNLQIEINSTSGNVVVSYGYTITLHILIAFVLILIAI